MKKVWMDCDTGFDDVIALMVIAESDDHELIGISTTVGNTSLENTTANTLAAVDFIGLNVPVHRGAAKPLAQEPQTIESLLGDSALGTLHRRLPAATSTVARTDAVRALIETLEPLGSGEVTLLATGPLTNIAMTFILRPDLCDRVEMLVLMGGSATTGNHTSAAEFNAYADPEAFDTILRAGLDVRMFGLDLTRQVPITPDHEERLRAIGTERAEVIADHVGAYLRMIDKTTPRPMALHDPSAAAYLRWPQAFTLQPARIDVELSRTVGRGATFCEFRVPRRAEPNAHVATVANGDEVMESVFSAVQAIVSR